MAYPARMQRGGGSASALLSPGPRLGPPPAANSLRGFPDTLSAGTPLLLQPLRPQARSLPLVSKVGAAAQGHGKGKSKHSKHSPGTASVRRRHGRRPRVPRVGGGAGTGAGAGSLEASPPHSSVQRSPDGASIGTLPRASTPSTFMDSCQSLNPRLQSRVLIIYAGACVCVCMRARGVRGHVRKFDHPATVCFTGGTIGMVDSPDGLRCEPGAVRGVGVSPVCAGFRAWMVGGGWWPHSPLTALRRPRTHTHTHTHTLRSCRSACSNSAACRTPRCRLATCR